jgi:CheY-like chemotaxis protein
MDMLMPVMNGVECVNKFREWEATQTGRPHQV